MRAGYRVLPLVYDRWQRTYGADYSTLILPRLLATIDRHKIPTTSLLDVACGTGSLGLMMARRGWSFWGIDASPLMVEEARRKFRAARRRGTILQQDMRAIRLPARVGLVTSMFDSVNHVLTTRDLLRVFRSIAGALKEGGYFIFDVNNLRCFQRLWKHTQAVHHRDFTLILQSRYEPDRHRGYSFVTLFLRSGDRYRQCEEIVQERWYSREEVRGALDEAGFAVVESEDFNFTDVPDVGAVKTWWVARKRQGERSRA
jgi:SAM-dependent methyltransferase